MCHERSQERLLVSVCSSGPSSSGNGLRQDTDIHSRQRTRNVATRSRMDAGRLFGRRRLESAKPQKSPHRSAARKETAMDKTAPLTDSTLSQIARKPVRIQRKRTKGWKMPPNAVVVSRPSIFGNPFRVVRLTVTENNASSTKWGVEAAHYSRFQCCDTKSSAVDIAVGLFRANAYSAPNAKFRDKVKLALRGKDLACWCRLDQPCHADVLLEIANVPSTSPDEKG